MLPVSFRHLKLFTRGSSDEFSILMNRKRIQDGKFLQKGKGLGTVDERMVRARAGELAVINGRRKEDILDNDLEEARRELTGQQVLNTEVIDEESIPEDQRWPGNAGSKGTQAETVPVPDEQTVAEKLVQEGVEEAEHDQMIRATRAAEKRDQ